MFTDRYIKVPIVSLYIEGGMEQEEETWEKINPFEISNYRPCHPEDDHEINCTSITLKNGEEILAYMLPEDFEKLLNEKFLDNT